MGGPKSEARPGVLRRPRLALSSLTAALRNPDILRVELVWAIAIGAEWAHFVALGVFAYDHGGASLVGLAGLVRLLPAGAVAPFASSLGDRVPRERLLLVLLLEVVALVASGAAALANYRVAVLLLAAVVGATSTLVRPAVQSILPLLAHTLVEAVPMFAPLSIAAKERVAASLAPVFVPAEETIVRAGEPGDTFYIVGSGRLAIERDGKQVASAEAGDYFGEIALVQDVPRTASVRAVLDSKLYALGRGAFFAAITLHPEAGAAARRVVAERRPPRDRSSPDAGDTAQEGAT
jgi:Cyclic nucleotide-binding domain